jgi:hypothetical protein
MSVRGIATSSRRRRGFAVVDLVTRIFMTYQLTAATSQELSCVSGLRNMEQ